MGAAPTTDIATGYRFVAKKMGDGKGALWRVYDLQSGSYPYRTPELGEVLQDQPEAAIQAEVDRLHATHGGLDLKKRRTAPAAPPATPAATEPDDDSD